MQRDEEREILRRAIKADPEGVIDIILELKRCVEDSKRRIQELEARLKMNSRNSSKPPGSDGYNRPSPKSQRKRSGRKSGGQKGHPGSTLQKSAEPDRVVPLELERCPHTGEPLGPGNVVSTIVRQVFELPEPRLEVTEYQAFVYKVPGTGALVHAPFPEGVAAPLQYGFRFQAWLVYLADYQLVPLRRVRRMCQDLFGLSVSEASVAAARQRCEANLAEFARLTGARLAGEEVLHADETGMRVGAKTVWLHSLSTERETLYHIDPRRGAEAIERMGVLADFQGWLIHDFWKAYLGLGCKHGICNSHIVRELRFFADLGQAWAAKLIELLLRARADPGAKPPDKWRAQYRRLVRQGYASNPFKQPPRRKGQRGRAARPKAVNLLDRLDQYEDWILAFIVHEQVPFTNNQAERDVRMAKVKQKISGCFRTWKGARTFATVRSYISTCVKRKVSVFEALTEAMRDRAVAFQ